MVLRVGILTLEFHVNYGGILQAAALYRLLSDEGFEPVILRKEPERHAPAARLVRNVLRAVPGQSLGGVRPRAKARARHRSFIRRFMPNMTRPCHNKEEMRAAVEQWGLDSVVVGSDQVWRADFHGDSNHSVYFLDFVPPGVGKLSYAASFGHPDWRYPDRLEEVSGLLSEFDAVSVRERSGVDICRTVLGRDQCELVLDPTLVVDPRLYEEAAAPPRLRSRPSLVSYVLNRSAASTAAREAVQAALPGRLETIMLTCDFDNRQVSVRDWLRAFKDADFVFTDSFHGTAFSILFGKRFITLGSKDRGLDRMTTLLDRLGLADRLVLDDDLGRIAALVEQPIDYAPVRERLATLRRSSRDFLLAALRRGAAPVKPTGTRSEPSAFAFGDRPSVAQGMEAPTSSQASGTSR